MNGLERAAVELDRPFGAGRRDPADDLRRVLRCPILAAGIDALRREREMEVLADAQAVALEQRKETLTSRAGIRRRLEHDQLPLLQSAREILDGAEHDRKVWLALRRE